MKKKGQTQKGEIKCLSVKKMSFIMQEWKFLRLNRWIDINVSVVDEVLCIDYRDSGPGISKSLLESGVIFEPEFTTKINGTGLGLAIAGEAAVRNGLSLKAIQAENGAHFILRKEE